MMPNRSGKAIEDLLASHMTRAGVAFNRQVRIGTSIFQRRLRADFVLINLAAFPLGLIVESKWQDSVGSVDEKFPGLVENIRRCYPMPTILVIAGKGAHPGAVEYLRSKVDGEHLIAVYDMEDFVSWVMRADKRPLAL
jgi:hypothetical protein